MYYHFILTSRSPKIWLIFKIHSSNTTDTRHTTLCFHLEGKILISSSWRCWRLSGSRTNNKLRVGFGMYAWSSEQLGIRTRFKSRSDVTDSTANSHPPLGLGWAMRLFSITENREPFQQCGAVGSFFACFAYCNDHPLCFALHRPLLYLLHYSLVRGA